MPGWNYTGPLYQPDKEILDSKCWPGIMSITTSKAKASGVKEFW